MQQQDLTIRQFGSKAGEYLSSPVHATGADLQRMSTLARRLQPEAALDLGCGAGHASYALARAGVRQVVACDLAPAMLQLVATEARNRGHGQIRTQSGAAEQLPFAAATFDLVVTRFSAHHWLDLPRALDECARVLTPGGTLIVIDILAPDSPLLDTVLQAVELLRDESHVRNYRESEWRAMLNAARFAAPEVARWTLRMEFQSWVARIGTSPPRVHALEVVFDALPAEARGYFNVTPDHSFSIDAGWLDAKKAG